MAKSSRGPRQKHRQAERPFVGNGCMSNSKYTHWRAHTRLMKVRARIPDVPVHVTRRLVNTTLLLIFPVFSLPAVNMRVAAFNIQKFGKSKVADPNVLEILVKVTQTRTL